MLKKEKLVNKIGYFMTSAISFPEDSWEGENKSFWLDSDMGLQIDSNQLIEEKEDQGETMQKDFDFIGKLTNHEFEKDWGLFSNEAFEHSSLFQLFEKSNSDKNQDTGRFDDRHQAPS